MLYSIYFFAVLYEGKILDYKCGYTRKKPEERVKQWVDELRRKCMCNGCDPSKFEIVKIIDIPGVYHNEKIKKYILIGEERDVTHSDCVVMKYFYDCGITKHKKKRIMLPNGNGDYFFFSEEGLDFGCEMSVEKLKEIVNNFVNDIKSGEMKRYSFTKSEEEYKKFEKKFNNKKQKDYNVVDFHSHIRNEFCDAIPLNFIEYAYIFYSLGITSADFDSILDEYENVVNYEEENDFFEILHNLDTSVKRCIENWLNGEYCDENEYGADPLF